MTDIAGKRVLVLEDEYFVASDIAHALGKEAVEVIGPAADVPAALSLLTNTSLDAAVLDVNLAAEKSYPLADALAKQGVPFMFLTGYDSWALPDAYRDVPRVAKPFAMTSVVGCVKHLLAGGGA